MASVSSLDKDLRTMRLGKYTPQAADEARKWIEESLGERLAAGDLLNALKDGIALCKYENQVNTRKMSSLMAYVKAGKSRNRPARCSLQGILHAIRPNGKHIPLFASLQVSTA